MHIRGLFLAASLLSCSGCVSVFEGTSQDIHVATSPAGANCVFERQGQNIGTIVNTPGVLTVRKNKYDITIRCDKPGYEQASYNNHSGVSGAIAANIAVDIILTAGIASIVDSANGADNKYDSVVNLTLVPVTPQVAVAAPALPSPAMPSSTAAPASPTPAPVVSLASAAADPGFRCPRAGTMVQYNNGTTLKFAGENGFRCTYVDQNLRQAEKVAVFADDAKFLDAGLGLLWPLSVGKQQKLSVNSSGTYLTHSFTVLRTERVETPAGSFDTFVVEEEESGNGAQWAKRLYWYAPAAGVVVKSTFTLVKIADMTSRVGTATAALVPGDYVATRIDGVSLNGSP